jgi:hypothetical protein
MYFLYDLTSVTSKYIKVKPFKRFPLGFMDVNIKLWKPLNGGNLNLKLLT